MAWRRAIPVRIVVKVPSTISAWRFEYRGQIGGDNGTLEPTLKGCQPGATDSLAPGRRHRAESLYQKAKKSFGLPLNLALNLALRKSLSSPLLLPGLTQRRQIGLHFQ